MQQTNLLGLAYALAAFVAWGFLPLYWKLLHDVPAGEILAHRIIWSFCLVVCLLVYKGRLASLKTVGKNTRQVFLLILCSLLIGANWFIYIWAVNANHLVEASLGYYINPLLVVVLGVLVLKERLNLMQSIAVCIASGGVIVITAGYGQVPWIALSLASTFATYGLFKKLVSVEATTGLAIETAILVPLAVGYLALQYLRGDISSTSFTIHNLSLLMGTGVVTALPLLWFAKGTQLISLSTVGFTQYIAPSISLFLGVVIFREPFVRADLISFGLIWIALVVYSFAGSRVAIKAKPGFET